MGKKSTYMIGMTGLITAIMGKSIAGVETNSGGREFKLFETHRAPKTFSKREIPASHQHTMNLQIGLKSAGMEAIEAKLLQVSDPNSPLYGQHLDLHQVKELYSPAHSTLLAVEKWLSDHGFDNSSLNWSHSQDWITLNQVPLRKVEQMLDTTYSYYQHDDGDTLIRTESYSLPHDLHSHIDLVQPTNMFGRLERKAVLYTPKERPTEFLEVLEEVVDKLGDKQAKKELEAFEDRKALQELKKQQLGRELLNKAKRMSCKRQILDMRHEKRDSRAIKGPTACTNPFNVTNRCLRELYRTDSYTLQSTGNVNKIGVTAYVGERANYEDLKMFLEGEGLPSNYNFTVVSANGGINPQNLTDEEMENHIGAEGNLDIQTTMGFTSPMPNLFYTTGGSPPFIPDLFTTTNSNEPYLEWLLSLVSQPSGDIPQVISTSYGDDEQTVPISYAKKVCIYFGILGTRGVSLIFPSGDDGVGLDGTCSSNDGKNTTQFIPIFPASCPFVTSVGATQNFQPEVAVSVEGAGGYTSGGGFSRYFDRPSYQDDHVKLYLSILGANYTGLYNRKGRGIPDVSAQGARYSIIWQKMRANVGGSSAAAPTFASVIALLNDYRLANGLKPMGFLNPWLYKEGLLGLNDIVTGSSSGCGTSGFAATRGWDAVTGLGTPDFQSMKGLMAAEVFKQNKC